MVREIDKLVPSASPLKPCYISEVALNFCLNYPAGPVGLNFDWSARFFTGPSYAACAQSTELISSNKKQYIKYIKLHKSDIRVTTHRVRQSNTLYVDTDRWVLFKKNYIKMKRLSCIFVWKESTKIYLIIIYANNRPPVISHV